MASSINCARNLIRRSTQTTKSLFSRTVDSGSSFKLTGLSTPRQRLAFSRLPVELGCVGESLMPLHSATASALLNSMLSSKVVRWGFLSEGFASTL